jgi:hypothetical protein
VLQEFGEVAVVASAEYVLHTLEVPVADRDFAMACDLHENREETETSVPDYDLLCTAFEDFRVDERPGLLPGQLQEDDALQHSQLRGRDAPAVSGGGAPVRERVGEVVDESSNFGSGGILNRQCDFPQAWVAELEDGLNWNLLFASKNSGNCIPSSFASCTTSSTYPPAEPTHSAVPQLALRGHSAS